MNCKPNDLAVYVYPSKTIPENIGRFFVLERVATPQEINLNRIYKDDCPVWVSSSGLAVLADSFGNRRESNLVSDACLRPIRPPQTQVTETTDQEVTA